MEDCRGREWTAVENTVDNLSKMGAGNGLYVKRHCW